MLTSDTAIQSIIIFLIGFAVICAAYAAKRILIQRTKGNAKAVVKALYAPIMVCVGLLTAYAVISTAFPEYISLEDRYFSAIGILLGTWAVYRTVLYLIEHAFSSRKDKNRRAVPVAKFAAEILILATGIFMILATLKIDITPLLASAGVVGIAAALAAQDFLGNIFGGIVLYTDGPFTEGDWVYLSNTYGRVLHVGLRSTRIMTEDSQMMIIPNSMISNNIIMNYSKPAEALLIRENVGVAYDSDVMLVKQSLHDAVASAAEKSSALSAEIETEVDFMEFGDSALIFELTFGAASTRVRRDAADAVNTEVIRIFRERGIEIPFPQRVITINKDTE
ncbi:MAG: mechanosensitive ion channel family protein [Methanocorpusculum sp.]|nr:mechanosensitive ion channel family protein [Methanocorpusculum parvum]MBQ4133964.1 mechanosensitive ion channel family protein [Methanocorpusculum sp.]HJJ66690.1 mechanosensitive ion channel family protein [Methanocorpusculum sp.]HJJ74449.1 mechanosensitive ion channel family protein [Methanocorpusculum sp.]HJJ76057.1 mechanosensitive ion channel family protein [Methanocorpusculum sp.]